MKINSWQNLPQPRWSKKRLFGVCTRWLKFLVPFLLLISLCFFWHPKTTIQPLKRLSFETNGMLTETWFRNHISVPWTTDLLTLDLENLQEQLLKINQIETVRLCRGFPDTLEVYLQEYTPYAKLLVIKKGKKYVRLMAADGTIFSPIGYSKSMLKALPTLSALPTKWVKDNKLLGFKSIATLFDLLKHQAPDLYSAILQVSLRHFDPALEKKWWTVDIFIRPACCITFPLENQERALRKLSAILKGLSASQRKGLKRINVSLTHPTVEFKK